MSRIKYTKNELKKQKESLTRFIRYLPTLLLKKQQLQMEIRKIKIRRNDVQKLFDDVNSVLLTWVDVFGEEIDITNIIKIKEIKRDTGNIAGIDIPLFNEVILEEAEYDLFATPLWIDRAIDELKKIIKLKTELDILNIQLNHLSDELRITSQRVNLFEKVKIPESRENMRVIKIYLGDQQTNAVVRGKIAKKKIHKG